METQGQRRLFRFATFEADETTGELRKQGMRVKLNAQAFQTLVLLLENPGQLVSRDAIRQRLWPEGTFVDFDHGLNSAVNRIREALGDSAATPRYIETLSGRGYRFLAEVHVIPNGSSAAPPKTPSLGSATPEAAAEAPFALLATPEELPHAPRKVAVGLFLLLQAMYLAFYIGALANLGEIGQLFSALLSTPQTAMAILIVSAAVMVPVRLFLVSAVLLHPPQMKAKYLKLFPVVLLFDELWALSPFLLLHHINFGLALAATAALVYSPFAQRSLILMMNRNLEP